MVTLSQLAVCFVVFNVIFAEACPLAGCNNQQARKKREAASSEDGKFIEGSAVVAENEDSKIESSAGVSKSEENLGEIATTAAPEVMAVTSESVVEKTETVMEKKEEASSEVVTNATVVEEKIEKTENTSAEVAVAKTSDHITDGFADKTGTSEAEKHEEVTVQSTAENSQEVGEKKNETIVETVAEVNVEAEKKETSSEAGTEKKVEESETTVKTTQEGQMNTAIEMSNETISENVTEISQAGAVDNVIAVPETVTEHKVETTETVTIKKEEVTNAVDNKEQQVASKESSEKTETNAYGEASATQQATETVLQATGSGEEKVEKVEEKVEKVGEEKVEKVGEEKVEKVEEKVEKVGETESSGEEPPSLSSASQLESLLKTDTENILVTHFKGAATTCSSPELRNLMHKALTDDIETSKSSLYDALHDYVPNGGFLIFCSEGRFSFKADAIEHCLVGNDKFNCYAFRA